MGRHRLAKDGQAAAGDGRLLQRLPDGVVDDRFGVKHSDFQSPEYEKRSQISKVKWEECRGLGRSFGYNRAEGEKETIAPDELIYLLVDIVSKNGNLLLDVGPEADGTIPPIQMDRLKSLGAWLRQNGEAIYGTEPWSRAEGETDQNIPVRFTQKERASLRDADGFAEIRHNPAARYRAQPVDRKCICWAMRSRLPGRRRARTWRSQLPAIAAGQVCLRPADGTGLVSLSNSSTGIARKATADCVDRRGRHCAECACARIPQRWSADCRDRRSPSRLARKRWRRSGALASAEGRLALCCRKCVVLSSLMSRCLPRRSLRSCRQFREAPLC